MTTTTDVDTASWSPESPTFAVGAPTVMPTDVGQDVPARPFDPEDGLGRAYIVGSLIGFVAVFLVCGGIALLGGVEPGAALGAGAFAGFWGGPGFGGMMGAVLHFERRPDGAAH